MFFFFFFSIFFHLYLSYNISSNLLVLIRWVLDRSLCVFVWGLLGCSCCFVRITDKSRDRRIYIYIRNIDMDNY